MNLDKPFYQMSKMFSEEFLVVEKYSLKQQKYISTCSYMPWKYTSLFDSKYKPELPDNIKEKLEKFCRFRFIYSTAPLYDESKIVKIEHVGEEILSYEIVNPFQYNHLNTYVPAWKHFCDSIDCQEIYDCKETIEKMTSVTDEAVTYIQSVEYNVDGVFSNINIYDTSYNLDEYTNNTILNNLNNFCKRKSIANASRVAGIIGIFPNSTKIKFRMLLSYSNLHTEYHSISRRPSNIINYSNNIIRDWYIKSLEKYDILTVGHIEYMNTLFNDKTKCDFEFLLDENGDIEDIHVLATRVYDFESLR